MNRYKIARMRGGGFEIADQNKLSSARASAKEASKPMRCPNFQYMAIKGIRMPPIEANENAQL